jgi:hypothetical protein
LNRELSSIAGSHSIAGGTCLVRRATVEDAQRADMPDHALWRSVQSRASPTNLTNKRVTSSVQSTGRAY